DLEEKPSIKKEDLILSPTSINTYADCPLKFKFQKILRVPSPSSSTLDLGSTIHKVVEKLAELREKGIKPTEKEAMKVLSESMMFRSFENKTEQKRSSDRAKENPQGELEIIDFKSGSVKKSKNTIKTDPQMNIYALGVKELYGKLPKRASLFYLEHRTVTYDITQDQVDEALKPIREMLKSILDGKFDPTPSYQACMFCDYQSICDAKVTEE